MCEWTPSVVRRISLDTAAQLGYTTNPALPLSDIPPVCRTQAELLDRLLGMHCLAACAYGLSRTKAHTWYEQEIHQDVLTSSEKQFLRTGKGNKQQFMVQIEAMWALAWALGLVEALDFGQACSPSFVTMLPNLKSGQRAVDLRAKASMRPVDELFATMDLAYCLHWAICQAGDAVPVLPGNMGPYVIVERRRALEWVLSADGWDEVPLDT